MTTKQILILNHKITLKEGQQYIATRPFAERGNIEKQRFDVSISPLGGSFFADPVVTVPGLTYDEASEFLLEFNNGGMTSDEGRIW